MILPEKLAHISRQDFNIPKSSLRDYLRTTEKTIFIFNSGVKQTQGV
jgi:hypothetical protein